MKNWLLLGIVCLGFVLRVTFLNNFPSGFTPDEASFGYDAYSILKTGADQWGHKLPLVFESFGDYKSPLYGYLDIPFVALFGLNKVAVRLPNAILGSLAVLATYLLATKLFNKKIGLITAFLFAISPWHIMLSRGAFEANMTTFFLPLGLYFVFNKKYSLGALLFGLNLFSYHTAKFVTPAVILVFILLYWKDLVSDFRSKRLDLIFSGVILSIFGLLTVYSFLLGAGSRVNERIITQGATEAAFVEKTQTSTVTGNFIARILHNKYQVIAKRFTENYFSYFSPQFLFTSGPREATYGMIPGRGVFLWFALPMLIAVRMFFYSDKKPGDNSKNYKKAMVLLGSWVFISVIPASLASGVGFSANRVAAMMPAMDIIIGIGGYVIFEYLRKTKVLLYSAIGIVFLFFGLFIEDYFIESPLKTSQAMLYGNLEMANYLKEDVSNGQVVIVDKSMSEPQIYFAFEQMIDPASYQAATKNWTYKNQGGWVDQMGEYRLGNLIFKDISKADIKPGAVLVGRPSDFEFQVESEKIISYPSGGAALEVVRL